MNSFRQRCTYAQGHITCAFRERAELNFRKANASTDIVLAPTSRWNQPLLMRVPVCGGGSHRHGFGWFPWCAIHQVRWRTRDPAGESTSVIFGMPSEAIKTGVVDEVLAIDAIPAALEKRALYLLGAAKVGAM